MEIIRKRSFRDMFRDHPGMFIGHALNSEGLHILIRYLLTEVVGRESQNDCSRVEVTIRADNSIVIQDNGRGLPLGPFNYGINQLPIEKVFALILVNHPDQSTYLEFGFLVFMGPILNAASQALEIETNWKGKCYRLSFERGEVREPLHMIGDSTQRGTRIVFKPDLICLATLDLMVRRLDKSLVLLLLIPLTLSLFCGTRIQAK